MLLHCVDRARLIDALRHRIARLDELIAKLEPMRTEMLPALPLGGQFLLRHIEQHRLLGRDWLRALLAEIHAGP